MIIYRQHLALLLGLSVPLGAATLSAQVALPSTVSDANRESAVVAPPNAEAAVTLQASLGARVLNVLQGNEKIKTYAVAVGNPRYPTPRGTYKIKKIVWNPSW
ncbi:MAG: L,D-transpeptidase, partial [Gemmatimonadaceae bacterium]